MARAVNGLFNKHTSANGITLASIDMTFNIKLKDAWINHNQWLVAAQIFGGLVTNYAIKENIMTIFLCQYDYINKECWDTKVAINLMLAQYF